ncbi:MAG: transcription termination factor NusA, partial [Fibrobacter sp.]|nr:transcription termination factor NusA [Fibrobacter sp.]
MKNEPKVNLLDVLKEVVEDKSVDDSVILDALKKALISAARKYLHIEKKINVDIDMETNE